MKWSIGSTQTASRPHKLACSCVSTFFTVNTCMNQWESEWVCVYVLISGMIKVCLSSSSWKYLFIRPSVYPDVHLFLFFSSSEISSQSRSQREKTFWNHAIFGPQRRYFKSYLNQTDMNKLSIMETIGKNLDIGYKCQTMTGQSKKQPRSIVMKTKAVKQKENMNMQKSRFFCAILTFTYSKISLKPEICNFIFAK